MAETPVGNEGVLNGTTNVTLVAVPAGSTQRIVPIGGITVANRDTAAVTLIVEKLKAATAYEIRTVTLDPDDVWSNETTQVLDATDESIRGRLSAAAATTNPDFTSSVLDKT